MDAEEFLDCSGRGGGHHAACGNRHMLPLVRHGRVYPSMAAGFSAADVASGVPADFLHPVCALPGQRVLRRPSGSQCVSGEAAALASAGDARADSNFVYGTGIP